MLKADWKEVFVHAMKKQLERAASLHQEDHGGHIEKIFAELADCRPDKVVHWTGD